MEFFTDLRVGDSIEDGSFKKTQLRHLFVVEFVSSECEVVAQMERQSGEAMSAPHEGCEPSRALIQLKEGIPVAKGHVHHTEQICSCSFGSSGDLPEDGFIEPGN